MEIVNVIRTERGILQSINSFVIVEQSVRRDADMKKKVNAAEKLFLDTARDCGMPEGDAEYCLDNGVFELGDTQLFLAWSETVNGN